MGNLGLVLSDIVLIIVALGGGILTLVRARRVGGLAVGLAGTACALLVLSAILDMVWWLAIFPGILDSDGYSGVTGAHFAVSFIGWLLIVVSIGLLFASTNVGRSAGADLIDGRVAGPAGGPGPMPAAPGAPGGFTVPPPAPAPGPAGATPAPAAQPTQGWTPPQQAQPNWNIHSGVWSIPHGTFDGPPPDQQNHR
ncbi:hypothetical protein [Virgisporangium ochraceum]|uniref:Uncharacterized protein n=1 Tax=Virgisporangium ochraceum TaxID=65505 RepID=A0A8J3ZTK1_9ACTN|nr:hypothetical protein [Virgisporangium ochraceum]GIJ69947.1 hypothetical protein Voc01_048640 [Virgisporangium ochraceum]